MLHPASISFKNKNEINFFRQTKSELIHFQQTTLLEMLKMFLSVRKKMIPEKSNLHRTIKSVGNNKHMGK